MRSKLFLGQAGEQPIGFNLDLLLRGRLLIQGSSGSGKSETVKKICAATQDQIPSIIIDPEGEYAPLRSGMPFLLIGPGGEVPATVETAELVAHRLLETGASAICDLYELGHARGEWVRRFLVALDTAPKDLRRECLLFIDEAHMFAPEQGNSLDPVGMAVADIASRGRKRGIGIVVVTQRLALLSNHIIGLCENLLIGRTGLLDAPRTAKLFAKGGKESREFIQEIGRISDGQFYAYGRAFGLLEPTLFQVERVPGQTLEKASRAGKRQSLPTPDQLKDLLPKFADLPAEAKAQRETLETLRARVRELEREKAPRPAAVTTPATPAINREAVMELREHLEVIGKSVNAIRRDHAEREKRAERIRSIVKELGKLVDPDDPNLPALALTTISEAQTEAKRVVGRLEGKSPVPAGTPAPIKIAIAAEPGPVGEGMKPAEQKILDAIAWMEAIGVNDPSPGVVAFLADSSPTSSTFHKARAAVVKQGFVVIGADSMRLTDQGRERANSPGIDPSSAGLQAAVLAKISDAEGRLLQVLIKAWPEWTSQPHAAHLAGSSATSSTFHKARARLVSLRLAELQDGNLRATDLLFPERA